MWLETCVESAAVMVVTQKHCDIVLNHNSVLGLLPRRTADVGLVYVEYIACQRLIGSMGRLDNDRAAIAFVRI